MTTAFVTGISGQDGSYLAERLLAEGATVHGLVREAAERERVAVDLPDAILHQGDLGDSPHLVDLVAEIVPDEIYNLGGISSVAQSWVEPVDTGAISGLAAIALLHGAWSLQERTGTEVRVLQASSAEIFGNPQCSPQDEHTPVAPTSPYGAAKAYAHSMARVFRSRGLHAVSLILYNHESPRRPPTFVTRKITQGAARIARGEQNELILGNLEARRDWGWAPDYVDAMVLALRHETPDDFVVATGESHSVRDFVAAAFVAAGVDKWEHYVRVDPALLRPTDAVELRGDASRAYSALGWHPSVPFAELVSRMVRADLA